MPAPQTKNPYLEGALAPWRMEGEIHDVEVVGEIPAELCGTYYRNGANPQFEPLPSYHIFDGDGMIHAFHFEDGRCRYWNRWVRTERFLLERREGERVWNGLTSSLPPDPRTQGISGNAANTAVVWHGGRLLALWEGGPPYALDPETLDTIGECDFDGAFLREVDPTMAVALGRDDGRAPGSFTAHPKIDPDTGEMLFFGYGLVPPYLRYGVVDAQGRLDRWFEVDSPFGSMMHDFIVTKEHVVFPVFPNTFSPENFAKTGTPLAWEPERGTHLGVMPRDGSAEDVVWVQTNPCHVFHFANAHSVGSRVVVELCRFDRLPLFGDVSGPPELWRWEIDAETGGVKQERYDDARADFPRIDDRRAGLAHRHSWFAGAMRKRGGVGEGPGFDSILHVDGETGRRRDLLLPDGDISGEPIFVPRSPDSAEGDGFLLFIAWRRAEDRSDLLILDAQNIDAEPLATLRMPHRVPLGFHGGWKAG